MVDVNDRLRQIANSQPYPLLFATVSGAHLYGFASVDSDLDLRGVHILPLKQIVGLQTLQNTIEGYAVRYADANTPYDCA